MVDCIVGRLEIDENVMRGQVILTTFLEDLPECYATSGLPMESPTWLGNESLREGYSYEIRHSSVTAKTRRERFESERRGLGLQLFEVTKTFQLEPKGDRAKKCDFSELVFNHLTGSALAVQIL